MSIFTIAPIPRYLLLCLAIYWFSHAFSCLGNIYDLSYNQMSVLLTPKGTFFGTGKIYSVAEITLGTQGYLWEKKHCPSLCPLGLTFFTCIMRSVITYIILTRKLKANFPCFSSILHPSVTSKDSKRSKILSYLNNESTQPFFKSLRIVLLCVLSFPTQIETLKVKAGLIIKDSL